MPMPMPMSMSMSRSLPSSPCKPALRPGALYGLLHPAEPLSPSDARPGIVARPHRPVLLQVTNITPALSSADPFSGHHGFYLRLSDSAHSCYVSLHADHDDLILTNGLHIGQLIEVDGLVPSIPAPILRAFRVLPGRHPCVQEDSGDIVAAMAGADSACAIPDIKEVVSSSLSVRPRRTTPPLPEKKAARQTSMAGHQRSRSIQDLPETTAMVMKRRELQRRGTDILEKLRKISVTSAVDDDSSDESDGSSPSSSSPFVLGTTPVVPRRSWDCTGSIKDGGPVSLRRTATISPYRLGQVSSIAHSDAAHELAAVRKKAEKALKVLSKRSPCASNRTQRELSSCAGSPHGSSNGIKWCKNNIIWSSLSPSLVRHGKEALKQRDMALQAALDALLEASTTEKLIHCLSVYSELNSDKDDDPKEFIERFLNFSEELDEAISIAQSQTKLRQLKTSNSNAATARAAAKAALERKQAAIAWIKAALESDLSSLPTQARTSPKSAKASLADAKFVTTLFPCCSKPKCNCSNKWRKHSDVSGEASGLVVAAELASALRSEGNRWFLKYMDKFLDAIESETGYAACDSQVASLLQQLKRVDDWLNRVARHDRAFLIDRSNRDSMLYEEEEIDSCERVRKKIYAVLLRHVQYTAMALESME